MSGPRARGPRGLTLIELIVSMGIMLAAISAAAVVVLAGTNLATVTERRGEAEDAARLAMGAIAVAVENAALGTGGGLYVGGAANAISPIYGTNGPTDALWLMVPDRNAMRDCSPSNPGGSTINLTTGPGTVVLACSDSFEAGDSLLVTNWLTGALLTNLSKSGGNIGYDENGIAGFSDSPGTGGYTYGDSVIRVRMMHYFVQKNPATGRPGLYSAQGQVALDPVKGPFVDSGDARLVQDNIEDLQVEYGLANGSDVAFQNGFSYSVAPVTAKLRALRITLVATTRLPQRTQNGATRAYHPIIAVDHDPGWKPSDGYDGYERVVYARRFELPNTSPSNL